MKNKIILFIIFMLTLNSCFSRNKSDVVRDLKKYNIILPENEFDYEYVPRFNATFETIKLKKYKYKTKYKHQIGYTTRNIEEYIYNVFIKQYILNKYLYDKNIGNNFEEIENIIDEYLLKTKNKFNIIDWQTPVIYIGLEDINISENRDRFLYRDKCYLISKNKVNESNFKECSNIKITQNKSSDISYLRNIYLKYINKQTKYDELNFSQYFEDDNKYLLISIALYSLESNKEKFIDAVNLFKNENYLKRIRKNYN
ncbi:hypothetical protein, partial [Oceanivirga salmonicida]|uniref:hypothetical protein n=1 Tax=Oceanivirga salmonicida TaxID=1769291 RepID=UPI0012E39408